MMPDVVIDTRAEACRLAQEAIDIANRTIIGGKTVDATSMRKIILDLANAILNLAS
jgi:hypothetical protein